ncbi:extracellular matrix protein FRAS1-like isoform X1 [Oreochromis aureus]|uniref:extracellular matrix protein FRAS1-like isoform X1 n=1 Tax=Oreochromis aureus TaxID=47969 RepID=UPI001952C608|nr:extracellular matrix protein FRAS1-like isoform X1 [Oreochromis aureus]
MLPVQALGSAPSCRLTWHHAASSCSDFLHHYQACGRLLPLLQVPGMRVQEGVRKTITEFELKATDADTEAESIVFSVIQASRHVTIERTISGQHYRQISSFTMDDIDQNRISYNHDGSNSLKYRFTFTVTDSTNLLFMVEDNGKEVCVCVSVCVDSFITVG